MLLHPGPLLQELKGLSKQIQKLSKMVMKAQLAIVIVYTRTALVCGKN